MTSLLILQAAWLLICFPDCWTKRAFMRDADGRRLNHACHRAKCFCPLGALRAIEAGAEEPWPLEERLGARHYLRKAVAEHTGDPNLTTSSWNDLEETTHHDVRTVFELAIGFAKEAA